MSTNKADLEEIFSGGKYILILRVIDKGASLLRLFIYASLLSPLVIGIYSAGVLAIGILKGVSQLGFRTALIQIDTSDVRFKNLLDTSWTVQVIRGFVLAGIAMVGAPFFARIIGDPSIRSVVMLLALVPILEGLVNPEAIELERDMDFRKYAIYWVSGSLLNLSVALIYLLFAHDVFGLVYGHIAGVLTRTIASYFLCDHSPRFRLVWDEIRELVDYGKWIFTTGLTDLVLTRLDDFVIGVYLGPTALGTYTIAYRVGTLLAGELRQILSRILLPKFSELKRSADSVVDIFKLSLFLVTSLFVPVGIGIALTGPSFVLIALGNEWRESIPLIRLLAVYGALLGMEIPIFALVQALGSPDIETRVKVSRVIVQLALIYWLLQAYGAIGVALTLFIAAIATFGFQLTLVSRFLDIPIRTFPKQFILPIIASVMMTMVLFGTGLATATDSIAQFVAAIVVGAVVYLGVMFLGVLFTPFAPVTVQRLLSGLCSRIAT